MKRQLELFYHLGINTIKSLEIPTGILASSKQEIFGCIFGRDSLITALRLLSAYDIENNEYYLELVKKIIQGQADLQGKEVNIESGEEPGKCIHEFRTENHERLTKRKKPWYVYPDGSMRNFDTIDATPLFLIAVYRYWQRSNDEVFVTGLAKHIQLALDWMTTYGDKNQDGFLDYQFPKERIHGGLTVHSWMDSKESLFHEEPKEIVFPVAPVEAQAYSYLALSLWSKYFSQRDAVMSRQLSERASHLKRQFNEKFVVATNPSLTIAYAIDGEGAALISTRSSIGHLLWASVNLVDDGQVSSIIEDRHILPLVKRLLEEDMFEPKAGIRTLSKHSREFQPLSYHNGSIWPHDNSMIAEGIEKMGYQKEAHKIRKAIFNAYKHFNTPIELFGFVDDTYQEYTSHTGRPGCREQAWSAASMVVDSLLLKRIIVNE